MLGLLPFVWAVHHFPLSSFDSEVVSAWCLGFALFFSASLGGRDTSIAWPLPTLLLGFSAIALAQQMLGMLAYSQQAIRFLLYMGSMLAAYVFGRRVLAAGRAKEAIDFFCAAVLIGGLYSVCVQWLQLLDIEKLPMSIAFVYKSDAVQQRPFGNLGQSNHLTTYLGMSALSALYLGVRARRTWLVVPSLLVIACGLAMTGSRMATAFLAILIGALFAPSALRPKVTALRWVAAAALLAGYIVGIIAVRTVAGDFDTIARFGANTWPLRRELWWQAWHIALKQPLLGLGVGQFPAGQFWVARPSPFNAMANNCHNIVLHVAAEFGWPAALAVGALALNWGVRDLRRRIERPELALAFGLLLLVAIHSMLEFPLWYLYFAIPAAFLFGLAEPERQANASVDVTLILPISGLAVLGVGLALSVNYSWIAQASAPAWLEANHIRTRAPEDALLVISIADSKLFQPEADRLMIDLKHPPDENTNGPMERTARLARALPVPELVTQYVVLLARAGRVEEATQYASRLSLFASDRYPDERDRILDQIRDLGPQTAPLRHALRELH